MRVPRLAIAATLLLVPLEASAQLARDFELWSVEGQKGFYEISLPFADGLHDVADTSLPDPCALDGGSGDGLLNADDLICTVWGGGDPAAQLGICLVGRMVEDGSSSWIARTAVRLPGFERFVGTPFEYQPGIGYMVHVPPRPEAGDLVHAFRLEGSGTSPFPGRWIAPPDEGDTWTLLHVPYDGQYRTMDEIFCGLEGVDWEDLDHREGPDTCTGGLWDGETPMLLMSFRNAHEADPCCPDGGFLGRHVLAPVPGGLPVFVGLGDELQPGEAYFLRVQDSPLGPPHDPLCWDPPTDRDPSPPDCGGADSGGG